MTFPFFKGPILGTQVRLPASQKRLVSFDQKQSSRRRLRLQLQLKSIQVQMERCHQRFRLRLQLKTSVLQRNNRKTKPSCRQRFHLPNRPSGMPMIRVKIII